MKAAVIVPAKFLDLIEGNSYHMSLTHVALMFEEYGAWFKEQRENGATVILDNSAYELDEPISGEQLRAACFSARPSILVIPDSIVDPDKNAWLAQSFVAESEVIRAEIPDIKFMGVPHGDTKQEYEENLFRLCRMKHVDVIGLSKSARRLGLRGELAKQAIRAGKLVHFLGVWDNPLEEALEGKELGDNVLGIDTSYPFRLGLSGRTLLEYYPTPRTIDFTVEREGVSLDWIKRQLDAFSWFVSSASTIEELEHEYKNGRF